MSNDPSVYDYLAKQNISELTVENLNEMTKVSAIDPNNIEFWSGVITVSRAMEHSRTFGYGLPIPESGDVLVESIADSASATVGPDIKTEIWQVERIDRDGCSVALIDSDGHLCPLLGSAEEPLTFPLYLTTTLKLAFSNSTGSTQTPAIAYLKVAL